MRRLQNVENYLFFKIRPNAVILKRTIVLNKNKAPNTNTVVFTRTVTYDCRMLRKSFTPLTVHLKKKETGGFESQISPKFIFGSHSDLNE